MVALPRCDELHQSVNSPEWEDMFILYYRRAVSEDLRLAIEINGLCAGLTAVIEEREHFIDELDILVDRAIVEDLRLAGVVNSLCKEIAGIIEERELLVKDLDILVGRFIPQKTVEFIRETSGKDSCAVVARLAGGVPVFQEEGGAHELSAMMTSCSIFSRSACSECSAISSHSSYLADSHATNDQLSVLFRREVAEDSQKVQEFRRLSSELREAVRMRDQYIDELKMSNSYDEIFESIEIMRRM
nr:hypothetical protein [Tanacetum cinerariifolium]